MVSDAEWVRVTGKPQHWHVDYLRHAVEVAAKRLAAETDPDERLRAAQGLELLKRRLASTERGEIGAP